MQIIKFRKRKMTPLKNEQKDLYKRQKSATFAKNI